MSEQNQNMLTVQGDTNVLAGVDFGEYKKMGFQGQTSRDIAVPFLALLQANSPQCVDGDPKRIPGAVAGDLLNTVTGAIIGKTAYIVPVLTEDVFVEWAPRDSGGGFQGVHKVNSPVVKKAQQAAKSFNELKTESGNELGETFYIYALLLDSAEAKTSVMPVVVAFNSSKIKVYRSLNTKLRTMKGDFPLCAFRLAVTSFDDRNKKNQPFKNFKVDPACGTLANSVNLPNSEYKGLLAEAKLFIEAIEGGLARAAYDTQTPEPGSTENEPF